VILCLCQKRFDSSPGRNDCVCLYKVSVAVQNGRKEERKWGVRGLCAFLCVAVQPVMSCDNLHSENEE
jgi:hypothetical protein